MIIYIRTITIRPIHFNKQSYCRQLFLASKALRQGLPVSEPKLKCNCVKHICSTYDYISYACYVNT
ncbi:hypothetical protein PUN28_018524 [Cardiocondyla obscurior]|uniref:Uncharacterized protein n=1 Tax=Cardiocondyla obscurior TaxID=286306 RepID=A0AAW2EIE4_9HYME